LKSYDSRTYSLNDFVEWDKSKQLLLNPKFQRRAVWTDKAKGFLMDTILRGKPIPKIFVRQKINVSTKTSTREVVDGQQRLRTILSYINDGFSISRTQNAEYGGQLFSQLPDEVQAQVLSYEVSVDLLINLPDSEILDIFSRLNSYAVVLNEQEKINANHFGPFKVLADKLGHKYYEFWTEQKIITSKQVMRMQEVNLVADLLIALIEGIKSKKSIKKFYSVYEKGFDYDVSQLEANFDSVIGVIADLYPEGLADSEFHRPHLFYTLFTAIAHVHLGVPGLDQSLRNPASIPNDAIRSRFEVVDQIYAEENSEQLRREQSQFLQDARRATTDESVRVRRTKFLLNLIAD
tara:strand:+ start:1450 stop:2496 length:1047 start_codon:yes stop_codon:yes gene_type:complete